MLRSAFFKLRLFRYLEGRDRNALRFGPECASGQCPANPRVRPTEAATAATRPDSRCARARRYTRDLKLLVFSDIHGKWTALERLRQRSVVIAGLQELDAVVAYPVDQPVLLGNAARPAAGERLPERFRLSNALKRISERRLNHFEDSRGYVAVSLDPVAKVLEKLALEDRDALSASAAQVRSPAATRRRT